MTERGSGTRKLHQRGPAGHVAADRLPKAGRVIRHRLDVGVRHAVRDGMHDVVLAVAATEKLQLLFDVHGELARQTGVLTGNPGAIGRMACRASRDVAVWQTATPDLLT